MKKARAGVTYMKWTGQIRYESIPYPADYVWSIATVPWQEMF